MSRFTGYWFDLKTLPGDARMAYRREGWTGVWKAMATRSLHRIFRRGRLVVFAHPVDQMVDLPPPAGVRISQPTAQEWPRLASLVGQRELQRFCALSARGRRCLVAWRGETPVGYAWVADDLGPDVAPSPLPLAFPSSAAYLLNLYVLPAERSSGIGSALASARLRLARETGFVEGWRMVAPTNAPSLRTVHKTAAGTRLVGEIRFVQLLGRTHARFTPSGRGPSDNIKPATRRIGRACGETSPAPGPPPDHGLRPVSRNGGGHAGDSGSAARGASRTSGVWHLGVAAPGDALLLVDRPQRLSRARAGAAAEESEIAGDPGHVRTCRFGLRTAAV